MSLLWWQRAWRASWSRRPLRRTRASPAVAREPLRDIEHEHLHRLAGGPGATTDAATEQTPQEIVANLDWRG
ncbi:hypothetical protein AB6N24_13105 [Cellulomonas sp. 179-A 4D5 NHS]|uniref:hypothetical protein n=1 Tax=Cellulomonas sp. 179-A 4D5 NHS TaxID=3142378 RepID=UPI0039A2AA75